jgi:hypothetical protein
MLSEQAKELTVLGQKIAGESAEPIVRSFNRPSRKPLDLSIRWACDAHDRLYL